MLGQDRSNVKVGSRYPQWVCGSKFSIAEDLHPFAEGQISRDKGRPALISLRSQVEEEFTTGAIKRHKSQLVHDNQVISFQAFVNSGVDIYQRSFYYYLN